MTTTGQLIPQLSIISMGFIAILCVAIPLIAFFAFKNRFHVKVQSFFMGIITYAIFGLFIGSFSNELFLAETSVLRPIILQSPVSTTIYVALVAGIAEEVGRYFCMSLLMRNCRKEDAFVYGIGHGGLEMLWIGTWALIQDIVIGMALNQFGSIESYAAQAGTAEESASITTYLTNLVGTPARDYLMIGLERIAMLVVQVGLSILIYKAVSRKKYIYIPLAIILHTAMSFLVNLRQYQVSVNYYLTDLLAIVLALLIAGFAFRQYQFLKYDEY